MVLLNLNIVDKLTPFFILTAVYNIVSRVQEINAVRRRAASSERTCNTLTVIIELVIEATKRANLIFVERTAKV